MESPPHNTISVHHHLNFIVKLYVHLAYLYLHLCLYEQCTVFMRKYNKTGPIKKPQ